MSAGSAKRGRSRMVALALIGAGLIVLGAAAFVYLPRTEASEIPDNINSAIPLAVSYAAPELSLTDLQGSPVALDDFLGTVVLVNNWATWCPPCKAEMPALQAYYERHKEKGFTIIAIESGDPLADVVNFVAEYGLTFPVWPDATMKSIGVFRNPGLPSSYVIDRNGTVRLAWAGAVSEDMLEEYVTPLLKE